MQKLARRTAQAEKQAARKLAKQKRATTPSPFAPVSARREVLYNIAQARHARREDWELGPLAPRRDVDLVSFPRFKSPVRVAYQLEFRPEELPRWGTVNREIAQPSLKLKDWQKEERWAWAGGRETPCLSAGDRVVVVEGVHKGNIATIDRVDLEQAAVFLKDLGQVNIRTPDFLVSEADKGAVPMAAPIPVSAVRLIHPLPDPKTGVVRDVIIKKLTATRPSFDRFSRAKRWHRLVPGLNVKIPWPIKEPEKYEDTIADTLRIDVERRTYVPTLLGPPMPTSLIDELRGKYSVFRTRHTDEYIAQKEAEEAAKKKAKKGSLPPEMLTPVQEYNRLQREKRLARGQPVLTDEMLAQIGEIMARNRNAAVAATAGAGLAETPPSSSGGDDAGGGSETAVPKFLEGTLSPPPPEPPVDSHPPPS